MENTKESERNLAIELLLVNMVETSGEHGLNAVDILVSYMNNNNAVKADIKNIKNISTYALTDLDSYDTFRRDYVMYFNK